MTKISDLIKHEPMVVFTTVVGLVTSIVTAVGQNSADGSINWVALTPVVAGIVLGFVGRNFTASPAAVSEAEDKVKADVAALAPLVASLPLPAQVKQDAATVANVVAEVPQV